MTSVKPGEYVIEVLLRDEGFTQELKSFTMIFLGEEVVEEEEEEEEEEEKKEKVKPKPKLNDDFLKLLAGFLNSIVS